MQIVVETFRREKACRAEGIWKFVVLHSISSGLQLEIIAEENA